MVHVFFGIKRGWKMTISLINTLKVKPGERGLPWEFNLLPFVCVAESQKHMRLKMGWLWFYTTFLWDNKE